MTATVFKDICCLYLPVDDARNSEWFKSHFNAARTRENSIIWIVTEEKGLNCNFITDGWLKGQPYEMFSIRFETDCIEELYERLTAAGDVWLEPLEDRGGEGLAFCFKDLQGNKFQVRQQPGVRTQPLRDDVPALTRASGIFFPVSDPKATLRWYTEFLGVGMSQSGQPVTLDGEELYFFRSLEPGRTLNFSTNADAPGEDDLETWVNGGDRQHVSMVGIETVGLDAVHRWMLDHGMVAREQIRDTGGCGRVSLLTDPDGNHLDIWELQVMVRPKRKQAGNPDWKARFQFDNTCFACGIDAFLDKVIAGAPGARHPRIQIVQHAYIREHDPEGLARLLETLEQFSQRHPEHAFKIVYREHPAGSRFGFLD